MSLSTDFPITYAINNIDIIDTHQHLWDLEKFTLPWLTLGEEPLGKSHTVANYAQATQGCRVAASIYMEVDVIPEQKLAEAQYIFDLCADPTNTLVGAVVGGDPSHPNFASYLDELIALDAGRGYLKGVRQVLHGGQPNNYCLSEAFISHIELLGEKNLSFDLCLRPDSLIFGAELAQRCPQTRFILDHCGNALHNKTLNDWQVWREGMAALAACPNVVACKISGIIAQAPENWTITELAPAIIETRAIFGPDRVMFASDWPVCTVRASLPQWIEALKAITQSWSESERGALFAGNARRVYGL